MAAQPKKKISRVRGRTRRAHSAIKIGKFPLCPHCRHPKPGHIVCPECGFYGSKKILTTKTDKRIAKELRQTKADNKSKPATKPPAGKTASKSKKTTKPTKKKEKE